MSELKHENWVGTTYGNKWMHRTLVSALKVLDIRLLYLFAYIFVVPPTMIINSSARKVTYDFYRKRFKFGKLRSLWMTYKNHCAFSEVVIDKFSMYAGKKFQITIDGYEKFKTLSKSSAGFVQLSSHIGNYEIAGYSLIAEDKRFNALVFGGEKESVMKNRNKLFSDNNIRMIPVKDDMSHLFVIDSAINNGEIMSMPADRIFGSQKNFNIKFLGSEAKFPQGPFVLAAVKDVPMLFVAVMKSGLKHYHIIVRDLIISKSASPRKNAELYSKEYVRNLEEIVSNYPAQWYNYFDFWTK